MAARRPSPGLPDPRPYAKLNGTPSRRHATYPSPVPSSATPHHIALLGDSIFDNQTYTAGAPDVVGHLRAILPPQWQATLFAIDGSTTGDLAGQLKGVPPDATHLVISLGGNDALLNLDVLETPVTSTSDALAAFGERIGRFEKAYSAAIDAALSLKRDTTVCTIYNADLEPSLAPPARILLMMFNDVILRVAFERGVRVIDLRLVCTEPADYAHEIEPSGVGGRKVALAIARSVDATEGPGSLSTVFGA